MTEENVTNEGQDENSPVIKSIRKQLREEQKARKAAEAQLESLTGGEAETTPEPVVDRAEVERQVRLELHADALGIPDVIHDQLAQQLDGQDITEDAVNEAYGELGFPTTAPNAQADAGVQKATELDDVASLGNQVAQASKSGGFTNLTDKINQAETPEELAQIMAEAGQS